MVTIYKLYFKGFENRCYIGITSGTLNKRLKHHIRDSKKYNHRRAKWLKVNLRLGREIIIEEIGKCEKCEALKQENIFILKYKEQGYRLYNSNNGGGGLLEHSEESRYKMSKSRKGRIFTKETRLKLSKASLGRKLSEVSRMKISKALTGKPLSEEHKLKLKLNHRGNTGKKFTEEHKKKISEANKGKLRGPQPLEIKLKLSGKNNKQSVPVLGINQITKQELRFDSAGEAYRYLNSLGIKMSRSGIYHNLSGKWDSAGGYKWSRIEDYK